jgi:hypothetical protein
VDHAAGIYEEPHTATSTGAGWLIGYWPLFRKRSAFVARPRNPDLTARFAKVCARGFTVPTNVDIPTMVGCYRSTTIESKGLLHEVSLRLECDAIVVKASIQHRRARFTSFRVHRSSGFCSVRPVPGNMHTTTFAYGYLSPSDCTNRDDASFLAVDSNRRGKSFTEIFRSGIENIAVLWVTHEIDQVDDAFTHSNLRL